MTVTCNHNLCILHIADYSVALEKELSDVKRTNRALKLALEEAQVAVTSAKAESSSQAVAVRHCSEEMSHLRAQLDESRQTVGKLQHGVCVCSRRLLVVLSVQFHGLGILKLCDDQALTKIASVIIITSYTYM